MSLGETPIPLTYGTIEAPTFFSRMTGLMRRRATLVLIDQAIVSAGNFLTAWVMLRHFVPAEWGIYNILLETLLYLNGLQAALVIYPLTFKGASSGDREELGRLTTGSLILTVCLLPLLGGATLFSLGLLDGQAIAVVAISTLLLWQLQETVRRALMADLRFGAAIWGDAIRYLGQTVIVFWMAHANLLSLKSALAVMGGTAAVATVIQAIQIGLRQVQLWQLRLFVRDFWKLGRWMLLANAAGVITGLGYWYVLLWANGDKVVGVFSAIAYPFKLANPIFSSMSGLLVPAVARAVSTHGPVAGRRAAMKYTVFGGLLLLPYFAALMIWPKFLLGVFSGHGSEYVGYSPQLQMFVINYTLVYFATMTGAWLAALGKSRWNFYAQVVNIVITLFISFPIIVKWGINGLIIGGMLSAAASTILSAWFIHRAAYKDAHTP